MIKRNLFYNSLLSVSQFIFPLITFPYSSRILGPSGIGSANFIDSITQYFLIFSTLGIPVYGVREISIRKNEPEELNKVFNEILSINIVSAFIFSLIYLLAALLIPTLQVNFNKVIIGIVLIISNVFMLEWFYQGTERFSYITARSLIVRTLTVVFLFALLKPGSGSTLYYGISASGAVITSILNVIFLKSDVHIRPVALNLKKHLKPLLVILGSTLAVSVYLLLDSIILGFIQDETAVGIYSTAIKIVKIPFAVILAISVVMVPQISRAYNNREQDNLHLLISKSYTLICLFCTPIAVGMFISSPFLVQLFAGNDFQNSIIPLQLLSPIIILVGLNNIFGFQILTPIGKEKHLLTAVLIGMVVSFVLNLCLIPYLSYTGAAISNLVTECVVTYMCYYFVKRSIAIQLSPALFFNCLFGALLFIPIAYIIRYLHAGYRLQEFAIIFCCIIFYMLYTWLFVSNVHLTNLKQTLFNKINLVFNS